MSQIQFPGQPGISERLRPGLRRVLAPNPSALTGPGTNTYVFGEGKVAVIDPGPDDPRHLRAILDALEPGERVGWIIATHAHLDHTALVPALVQATGAPVLAYGNAEAGRRPRVARDFALGGGEGVDQGFRPDEELPDGACIHGPDWTLEVLHTPGHFGNHICLAWDNAVLSGDHVMGWSTTLVSPPDGDMGAYMASLARLARHGAQTMYPGHGGVIEDAPARLAELTAHRLDREAQILAALQRTPRRTGAPHSEGPGAGGLTLDALTRAVYTDVAPMLLPAAARNVLAHLVDLEEKSRVSSYVTRNREVIWSSS